MPLPDYAVTVGIAAGSGIAVLAYKTPKVYLRMLPYLAAALTVWTITGVAWNWGVHESAKILKEFIPVDKRIDAQSALDRLSNLNDVVLIFVAGFAVLFVFTWVAYEVLKDKRDEAQKMLQTEKSR